jgi:L-ribulose-5-phosphate 4-epimerase
MLTEAEVRDNYEMNTGLLIAETFRDADPCAVPSVLVNCHGPFSWGSDVAEAVRNAVALEEIARMAHNTVLLGHSYPMPAMLLEKHFKRKHGKGAYYGQKGSNDR